MSAQKPVILKKSSVVFLKPNVSKQRIPVPDILKPDKKYSSLPLFREDVIFESNRETFLRGEYQSITIVNRLNNLTQSSRTIAKCTTHNGVQIEKTSDNITRLLGQEAYNTIFYSLCSVINQEYRIKGILALLTVSTKVHPGISINDVKTLKVEEKSCQTYETRIDAKKSKTRKRIRKVLAPHVVQDPPDDKVLRKVVIDPATFMKGVISKEEIKSELASNPQSNKPKLVNVENKDETLSENSNADLPDLGYLQDENSNDSIRTSLTMGTYKTTPELLLNPMSLVSNVERNTKENETVLPNYLVILSNKNTVRVPFKPEDNFHIASKENLQFLNDSDRKNLLLHQMKIDYKYCLTAMDEDGNLPLHIAVINDDIELLKRQCIVLKIRNQSVDVAAANGLTALKLSLFRESAYATSVLLSHGANPLLADEEHSACLHHAAELKTDHLATILHHVKMNARRIISEHAEELQSPGWETSTDEDLNRVLLEHICCRLFDKRGYTPLMLASKLGHYENVRLLLEEVPTATNIQMPSTGHTALYLAVAAACAMAAELGNKSKIVDHFRKTIEILLESGADPSLGTDVSNVNTLLSEFNCSELSMMVVNKVISTKYFNGEEQPKNFDKFVLVNDKGDISIKEIDEKICKSVKPVVQNDLLEAPVRLRKSDLWSKNVNNFEPKKVLDIVLNSASKRKLGAEKKIVKKCKK